MTKYIIEAKIRPVGAICFRNYRDEISTVYQNRLKKLGDYHMEPDIECPTDLRVYVGRKLREWLVAGNEIASIEKMNVSMFGPTLAWWWIEIDVCEKELSTYDVNVYVEGKTVVLRGKNFIAECDAQYSYLDEYSCRVKEIISAGPVHDKLSIITVFLYFHGSSYLSVSIHNGRLSYTVCEGNRADNVYLIDSKKVRIYGTKAGKYVPIEYNIDDPELPGARCGFSLTMSNCLDVIREGRLICRSARGLLIEWEKNNNYAD